MYEMLFEEMNMRIDKMEKVGKITQSLVKDEGQVLKILEDQIGAWQEKVEGVVSKLDSKIQAQHEMFCQI